MYEKDTRIDGFHFAGKELFVFDDHAVALKAWSRVRRSLEKPPLLLTLDHHTDTHEPFIGYAFSKVAKMTGEGWELVANDCIRDLNYSRADTVEGAVQKLRNDEHIRTAIEAGVLEAAIVLSFNRGPSGVSRSREVLSVQTDRHTQLIDMLSGRQPQPPPPRPHTYDVPGTKVFYLPNDCWVGCEAMPHTEDCRRPHADQVIESVFLDEKLAHCHEMVGAFGRTSLFEAPYVLDIDLDYFMTKASLAPKSPDTFFGLLKGAFAITIAREPRYVEHERIDDDLDWRYSFGAIWDHVRTCLCEPTDKFTF